MMEEVGHVQLEPDVILPSQFLPHTIATPEKRLLLAVLLEAVGTFQRYVISTCRQSRAMFSDAEVWFASEDASWPYSFISICDALGIDATYVRSVLRRWLDTHLARLAMVQPIQRASFRRVNATRHRTNGRPEGMQRRA